MFKKGVILSVAAGIALVGWWAFNAAQARVCFLPDSDCDMDNSQGLADGEHLPDPVPNSECGGYNLSYSETASYDKNCYECESCESNRTKYKCWESIKTGYELIGGECKKKCPTGSYDSEGACKNGLPDNYSCVPIEGYPNCYTREKTECPTGFARDVTCKEPKVEHETVKGCYICDDCENGAKRPGCKAGYKETDTGKKSSYSQSVCYVCEKDGCDENAGYFDDEQECNMHYGYNYDGHCQEKTVDGKTCWVLKQQCDNGKGHFNDEQECLERGCNNVSGCRCILENGCYKREGYVYVVLHFGYSVSLCQDWYEVCGKKEGCDIHGYRIWIETYDPAPEEITATLNFTGSSFCSNQNTVLTIAKNGTKSAEKSFQGECREYEDIHDDGGTGSSNLYDCEIRPDDISYSFGDCRNSGGCNTSGEEFEHNGIIYNLITKSY